VSFLPAAWLLLPRCPLLMSQRSAPPLTSIRVHSHNHARAHTHMREELGEQHPSEAQPLSRPLKRPFIFDVCRCMSVWLHVRSFTLHARPAETGASELQQVSETESSSNQECRVSV
jgi:hypothetical protein